MNQPDQPTYFTLPPRVGVAFNMVTMMKEIPMEYEAKSPRDMTQHELSCYRSCLDTIRLYVNGEMSYGDTIEPIASPSEPLVKNPPLKQLLGTTANTSPFIL